MPAVIATITLLLCSNCLWAGLCLVGGAFFMFRDRIG
jgi:uncharacterized protein (DUF486 family)